MNTKVLLTALATAAISLSMAQAQNDQLPRSQRLGRAVPATALLNRDVVTQGGKQLGQVEEIIFDMESGRILYLAMDLKGLGANDTVTVPPALFTYGLGRQAAAREAQAIDDNNNADNDGVRARRGGRHPLVLRASEESLKGAPKFAKTGDDRAQGAYVDKIYAHFNQPRWWEGASGDSASGKFNHIRRASQVKNFTVQNVSSEKLGQVETVLFDLPAGRVTFVILDPANRVANKQMLVPIPPMAFTRAEQGGGMLTLDADKEKLNNAPSINREEMKAEDIQRLSNPTFAKQVYEYYGKKPWFGDIPSPTGPDRP
jgi:sporulation protein YlmC with PRC-barrel domain